MLWIWQFDYKTKLVVTMPKVNMPNIIITILEIIIFDALISTYWLLDLDYNQMIEYKASNKIHIIITRFL